MVAQYQDDPNDEPYDRVRVEMERIRRASGGVLLPSAVVTAARFPSSPLHSAFEWDDAKAAHAHRLDTARQLIRSVEVRITVRTETFSSVAYVKDPDADANVAGYRQVSEIRTRRESADLLLTTEVGRVAALITRVRSVARGLGRERDAEAQLKALLK